jgi:hypothetical protein
MVSKNIRTTKTSGPTNAWENTRYQTRTIQHEIPKYKRLNFGMLECSAFVFLETSTYVTPYPRELRRGSPLGLNVELAHRFQVMFWDLAHSG